MSRRKLLGRSNRLRKAAYGWIEQLRSPESLKQFVERQRREYEAYAASKPPADDLVHAYRKVRELVRRAEQNRETPEEKLQKLFRRLDRAAGRSLQAAR